MVVPNPSGGDVELRVAGYAEPLLVEIFDASGRLVRRWGGEGNAAVAGGIGSALRWDGRDDKGRMMPAGVYLVRMESARGMTRGTVIRAR